MVYLFFGGYYMNITKGEFGTFLIGLGMGMMVVSSINLIMLGGW